MDECYKLIFPKPVAEGNATSVFYRLRNLQIEKFNDSNENKYMESTFLTLAAAQSKPCTCTNTIQQGQGCVQD